MSDLQILKINEVVKIVKLSASTIKRLELLNKFPKRIMLSEKTYGWTKGQLDKWIEDKIND